jgi:subtilisin family serine protease
MKTYLSFIAVLTGLVATSTSATALANSHFIPGEFLVKMKNSAYFHPQMHDLLSNKLGSYIKSVIPEGNLVVIQRPIFEDSDSIIDTLENNPLVEYVEPNFLYHPATLPNDVFLGEQWGLKNSGQKDAQKRSGFQGMDIGAEQAWQITTGSSDVVVAVIDSGINYNHPDLKDNIWTNTAELNGKPGVDDDGNGYIDDIHGYSFESGKESGDPMDMIGHGSHCAGIIGARGNNGLGIVGVNWNVKIMVLKFIGENGEGSSEGAIKAIDYAIKNGAKIISNSWGGGDESKALLEAIERANKKGILFIAAAGNDMADNDAKPFYPASYPVENVISVTAVDNQGRLAPFANYGKKSVHVGAPGVNIASTIIKDYVVASGTSMAAPFVSGVAALLLAHEPNLSHLEIKDRILSTTKPISGLQGKVINRGLVNAYFALTNTQTSATSDDPSNWENTYSFPAIMSSNHPYLNKTNQKFDVKVPGAKQFSLFFPKVSVDYGFDFVIIKDSTGKIVDKIADRKTMNIYSAVIDGDTATVEFISDKDINGWGFDITKAVWR